MKRIISLILISIVATLSLHAQGDNTVIIKGTYKGNAIYLKGNRTPSGTIVKQLDYKPLTALEQEVERLKSQKNQLEKQKNQLAAENERLKKNKPTKNDAVNTAVNDSLEQVTKRLKQKEEQANAMRTEIESLKNELQAAQTVNETTVNQLEERIKGLQLQVKRKGSNTDFLLVQMEVGVPRLSNSIIAEEVWSQPVNIQIQGFRAAYAHYFTSTLPIAIKAGVGLGMYDSRASFHANGTKEVGLTDPDGMTYDAIYTYRNVSERISLRYLDIPVVVHIGNSFNTQGIQAWCDLGVMPSFKIGEKADMDGKYSKKGYYRFDDGYALVEDVEELGLRSNVDLGSEPAPATDANPIVIWAVAEAGINIPIGKQVGVGVSARCAYSVTPASEGGEKPGRMCLAPEHSSLLSGKTRMFTAGLNLSVAYNF